jgi:hypothetical protein
MIREREVVGMRLIDLTGPEGNAYCLMAYAKKFARTLDLDGDAIITEMTTGNYENLVQVFDKHFGSYIILER